MQNGFVDKCCEIIQKEEKEAKEVCYSHVIPTVFLTVVQKLEKKDRIKLKKSRSEVTPTARGDTSAVVAAIPQSPPAASAAVESDASESTSPSSSESETTTGVDADTEESMTSEEETEKLQTKEADGMKEKWVAVKGSPTAVVTPASATVSATDAS